MNKKKSNNRKSGNNRKSKGHGQVTGTLDITRSGLGFVNTNDDQGDILVRPADFNKAFHGDTVRVDITKLKADDRKREGKITEIVKRKTELFIGTLQNHAGRWFFAPESDKPIPRFELTEAPGEEVAEDGKVVARFLHWDKNDRRPVAEWVENLDMEAQNDVAMKEILLENGFPLSFSDDAQEEAARLNETITQADIDARKDFRDVLTFTIDPVDAQDFDDAISFRQLGRGNFEIGVHIADVSHFVTEHTNLDNEAYQRATSVYLPDRVNPMLPEEISNVLCSLRPNEDKFAFSAVFTMNSKGEVKDQWLGKTLIHSNRRFTYEEVQSIIDSGNGDHAKEIITINKIARELRKQRFANGAINFSSQEVRFVLDEDARPIGIEIKESTESHQLIEEFMLLANRKTAETLSKARVFDKQLPVPYRIHDLPDEDRLAPFTAFAKKFGYHFDMTNGDTIARSFNQMLAKAQGTPQQHVLEQLGIRTMAKAIYSTQNIGHYGLGFDHYLHFTSPIRRYPDILVHRLLQQLLDDKLVVDKKLEEKCKHCSERERAAVECERTADKYKQVEFLSDYVGEEFEAVISGVATFGFWAETVAHKCEGLVSIRDLNYYDDFRLVETDYSLVGVRSGRKFRMGDTVTIKVISANLEKKQLDFDWVPPQKIESRENEIKDGAPPRRKKSSPKRGQAPIPKNQKKGRKKK